MNNTQKLMTSALLGSAALGLICIRPNTAHAQASSQERRQEQRQDRREVRQTRTPEQQQARQERMQQWQQQRMQQGGMGGAGMGAGGMGGQQQRVEDPRRVLLRSAGVTDRATQDAVIAFDDESKRTRQPLLAVARELSAALADQTGTPEEQSTRQSDLLKKFQEAATEYKLTYETSLTELDTKINYSTTPRLKSVLTLIGVLGHEAEMAGGFVAIFPNGVAGAGNPQPMGMMPGMGMPGMGPGEGMGMPGGGPGG